jgi:cobalt-zinc-cadmium efflux system outer membrane protein
VLLTQPIDLPNRRNARISAATAGFTSAQAGGRSFEADVIASLRLRYFDLLRREAEIKTAREDQGLMEGIRARISAKVQSGESARYELIKADSELLNAIKVSQAALLRAEQVRSSLRQTVGTALPNDFSLIGQLDEVRVLPSLTDLRTTLLANNPTLAQARAQALRARHQLELEQALRWPNIALKAGVDEDPELRSSRLGVAISLPIWDRRRGPINEAVAEVSRTSNELQAQEFALSQELDVAYQQHEIARTQVLAFETGIVRQAEAALNVAQSAYRFGERNFLDVLDAQRVYRAVRNDLITARFELASAWADIERLRAGPAALGENTP